MYTRVRCACAALLLLKWVAGRRFPEPEPVPPPVLGFSDVDFGYPDGPRLFQNLNFGLDMESRLAIVGPNGRVQGLVLSCCVWEAASLLMISYLLS